VRTNSTNVVYYLHADHLGSTSLATTAGGGEVTNSRTWYHPYGTVRAGGSTLPTDYTFTGQRNEAGIGLMDYHARFYAPVLGRFISADTLVPSPGNPQSLNRYSYVLNSPLRYNDPSGHCVPGEPGCLYDEDGNPVQPPPPPLPYDISRERHEHLLTLRAMAETLSARCQLSPNDPNYLTDVEAMALLFDTAAPLYQRWYGPIYVEDRAGFIYDLGIVVGGIEARGTIAQHVASYLRGESLDAIRQNAFRNISADDPNDPLGQYYMGYDNFRRPEDRITGFREEYRQPGQNQVRHFVGGLVIAHAFLGAGRSAVLGQESEDYDRALYQAAFRIHDWFGIADYGSVVRSALAVDENR
jgi:RHS repeat-associated protein